MFRLWCEYERGLQSVRHPSLGYLVTSLADNRLPGCSATKLIAKAKEREALNAQAAREEEGEEADGGQEGIEIEGLETVEDDATDAPSRRRAEQAEEEEDGEEYEEEEEEQQPVRRRPVIEYQ